MTLAITTLKNRADFLRLRRGRKRMTPYFILRADVSEAVVGTSARVGYTVTTKCGNAVVRNRIKRRLRALVRELFPASARGGYDYILIARSDVRPGVAEVPFAALREAMQRAVAGIHRDA
ncbi:MAG: ribonuclease P protein component [Alphaproteobacteria bacterium]|nr:ribonuclease P protein component [Alphaproteobacteria bacterium]